MKQIFIAASWSRRAEVRTLAEELEYINLHIRAGWLYERELLPGPGRDRQAREFAYNDIRDIRACDIFVRLADDLSEPMVPSHIATGGRMFEQGLAYGLGKEIYVVGGHQMLYDHMPRVVHVKDKEQLKRELTPDVIQ